MPTPTPPEIRIRLTAADRAWHRWLHREARRLGFKSVPALCYAMLKRALPEDR